MVKNNLETNHDPELKQFSFSDIEAEFDEYEKAIRTHTANLDNIRHHENELIEIRHVIELGSPLRESVPQLDEEAAVTSDNYRPILSDAQSVRLNSVTGVIPFDKIENLHRMCYMMSRGNIYIKTIPIPEKTLSETVSFFICWASLIFFYYPLPYLFIILFSSASIVFF